ncbi:MAG TPA: methyltransferase domain-containing protein [Burkholderiales bacterium]|nr:methyltransferase domain-containing protein [Burkholderiales bacterium]
MTGPTREFWEQRFADGNTPWDRGAPNPQLAAWLEAGALAPGRILVPGCGSGYEVAALAARGFEVTALDYADAAVARTRTLLESRRLSAAVVQADALQWRPPRPFDAVYEQTCLCALYPDHWRAYADRLRAWLRPGGRLFALFMQFARPAAAQGSIEGPPYHCDIVAMRALFPAPLWGWPKPPYPRTSHPSGLAELAVILERNPEQDKPGNEKGSP